MEFKNQRYQQFELVALLLSGLLKFILMDRLNMRMFYISGISLFWFSYILYRYSTDRSILKAWGISTENFRKSIILLLPLISISILACLIYGILADTLILSWHILPVLILYPVWGTFQQFLMLSLIGLNIKQISNNKLNRFTITGITAVIFSLIHYPSFLLMIFTFFMEILFVPVFMKWRNLWALGLAHGIIGSFLLYYVLERDLWSELFNWFQI
jgi:hypothetical protein